MDLLRNHCDFLYLFIKSQHYKTKQKQLFRILSKYFQFVVADITPKVERNSLFKTSLSKIRKHADLVTFAGLGYERYENEDSRPLIKLIFVAPTCGT